MMRGPRTLLLLLALVFSGSIAGRAEKVERLKATGYINDFADVLSPRAKEQLAALCAELDSKAHAQIAVVTVRSLEGVPVEEFANELFKRWGIGSKGENRGVLILLAVGDHKYRTEVGYGLEPILPDGKVGGFGREMVPLLRQSDYDGALLQMTGRVAQVIAEDRGITLGTSALQPAPGAHSPGAGTALERFLRWLVVVLIAYLLFGPPFRRRSFSRGGSPIWWGGGPGWGGGGFGGGGGGGFGGFGGGLSGGGGASGSW